MMQVTQFREREYEDVARGVRQQCEVMPFYEQAHDDEGLDDVSDTVLYDIFYESGTQAGGYMVALENLARRNGDVQSADQWRMRNLFMRHERDAIEADDRCAQIAFKNKWDRFAKEMSQALHRGEASFLGRGYSAGLC